MKAVLFDLGGVVLTQTPEITFEILAEIFNAKIDKIHQFFKTVEVDWVTGKISARQMLLSFKNEFMSKDSVGVLLKNWKQQYLKRTEVNKEVMDLVDKLRVNYKVYLFTDTFDINHKLNAKRNIFKHFNKVFASFIVGKRKTTKDFYLHLLKEIKIKPEECLFIDDRKEYLNVAKKLSINTIVFKNPRLLRRELIKLNLL